MFSWVKMFIFDGNNFNWVENLFFHKQKLISLKLIRELLKHIKSIFQLPINCPNIYIDQFSTGFFLLLYLDINMFDFLFSKVNICISMYVLSIYVCYVLDKCGRGIFGKRIQWMINICVEFAYLFKGTLPRCAPLVE